MWVGGWLAAGEVNAAIRAAQRMPAAARVLRVQGFADAIRDALRLVGDALCDGVAFRANPICFVHILESGKIDENIEPRSFGTCGQDERSDTRVADRVLVPLLGDALDQR